jgi:bifunctional enzyme CysN/CysC
MEQSILDASKHIHPCATTITRMDRARLHGHAGQVIWFTGLSGSGKSTLANALEVALHERGMHTYLLDGDNVRSGLNRDLGFSEEDRIENIRRIAEVARLMLDAGLLVMTAFISPFARDREMARDLIGPDNFLEVHVHAPLEVCEERDVKGLYKLARAGKIAHMTGIDSPYEVPIAPHYTARTDQQSMNEIIDDLLSLLAQSGPQGHASASEASL